MLALGQMHGYTKSLLKWRFSFLSPFKNKASSQALVIREGLATSKQKPSQSKGEKSKNTEKSVSLKTTG